MNLIHGDCIEEMRKMNEGCIDLTVTSPPYDNLRTYAGTLQWGEHVWKPVLEELYRVTADGGVVVWVVGDATIKGSETGTSFKQALYAMECGFRLHDTMIYEKNGFSFPDSNRCHQTFEYMFVLSKGSPNTFNQIKDRKNSCAGKKMTGTDRQADGTLEESSCIGKTVGTLGGRFNVWKIANQGGGRSHPAAFPESLAHDHIISWSNEGDTVFDPFLGSGTTGKMANQLGRNFIGIEKVEKYYEIAKERICHEIH